MEKVGVVKRGVMDEMRNYIFLIFSTEKEVEDPKDALKEILEGKGDGYRVERVVILKNPIAKPDLL